MNTFALSATTLKTANRAKPNMERTRELLRQYQEAEAKLEAECRRQGIAKPKLMAK